MECRRGLAMRILSVCPFVRPSNACFVTKWKKDRSRCISFSLDFWEEEWLVRAPLLPEILGQLAPVGANIADFQPIFARSSSAVTPSEKSSVNTNRKSTTRFPMSLRRSSYVAPKSLKGGLKNEKRPISA